MAVKYKEKENVALRYEGGFLVVLQMPWLKPSLVKDLTFLV